MSRSGRFSVSVVIISGLKLDAFEAEQLRAVALRGVGRDCDPNRYECARQ
jgi:hypothetical protein